MKTEIQQGARERLDGAEGNARQASATFPGIHAALTNWSKTEQSRCSVFKAHDSAGIRQALTMAQRHGLSVIAHGAGHSFTDAALNTNGMILDVTGMRRMLHWDPQRGIMRVEPGVTLGDVTRVALPDGWWPPVTPSTAEATIGGCVAMNVTGKNAWKCGSFGEHVLAMDVLFATGQACTLTSKRDPELFSAFVGSAGLLGVITSVTLQLQRISSDRVSVRTRSAASLADIFAIFMEEQQRSDFLEAWIDGFAEGPRLGRGHVSCASLQDAGNDTPFCHTTLPDISSRAEIAAVRLAARVSRVQLTKSVALANSARYWRHRWGDEGNARWRALVPYTYYSSAALAGYHALLPAGFESFHAFVPQRQAQEVFEEALHYSQWSGLPPIWCVLKQHRPDPFLLSYQVDGFSLELYYPRTRQTAQTLERVLPCLNALALDAGGRLYLAKDHVLTQAQYRQSAGDAAVEAFLALKRRYDPEMRLQSNLFRRVFEASL